MLPGPEPSSINCISFHFQFPVGKPEHDEKVMIQSVLHRESGVPRIVSPKV